MTKLLALEASSDTCSVTLLTSDYSQTCESEEVRSHSQLLLPFIDEVLSSKKLKLTDLDFIACSQGPGSFTGLRICFSVAQALAFGVDCPLLTVCSLESMALANRAQRQSFIQEDVTIAVIDARMDQVYWAAFLHQSGDEACDLRALVKPCLQFFTDAQQGIIELMAQHPDYNFSVVGSGVSLLNKPPHLIPSGFHIDKTVVPTSGMSAQLALYHWSRGRSVKAEDAQLVYLRDTISWKKRTKIRV